MKQLAAPPGVSCAAVCGRAGGHCDAATLEWGNNCESMARHFGCEAGCGHQVCSPCGCPPAPLGRFGFTPDLLIQGGLQTHCGGDPGKRGCQRALCMHARAPIRLCTNSFLRSISLMCPRAASLSNSNSGSRFSSQVGPELPAYASSPTLDTYKQCLISDIAISACDAAFAKTSRLCSCLSK